MDVDDSDGLDILDYLYVNATHLDGHSKSTGTPESYEASEITEIDLSYSKKYDNVFVKVWYESTGKTMFRLNIRNSDIDKVVALIKHFRISEEGIFGSKNIISNKNKRIHDGKEISENKRGNILDTSRVEVKDEVKEPERCDSEVNREVQGQPVVGFEMAIEAGIHDVKPKLELLDEEGYSRLMKKFMDTGSVNLDETKQMSEYNKRTA